jgi:hypothetical protein
MSLRAQRGNLFAVVMELAKCDSGDHRLATKGESHAM